ncbi:MAG TPA: hypothetical protein VHO23_00195 [Candidatus Paceibacterota bacterium]|nr:hypothetical protein [Candidatus Paceibacterota bacterium]
MDIFFAVTTVSIVVLTVLVSLVLVRLLAILRHVERVSELVEAEGAQLREDIAQVREGVRREGMRIGQLIGFLGGAVKPRRRARKTTNTD